MSTEHLEYARRCPACAAVVDRREWKCWVCQHVLAWQPAFELPPDRLQKTGRHSAFGPHQFSLSTLFFVMTVISVHLGALAASPPLGGCLLPIGLLALFRTFAHFDRLRVDRPTMFDRFQIYVASILVTMIAAFFAWFVLFAFGAILVVAVQLVSEVLGPGSLVLTLLVLGMIPCFLAASRAFIAVYWKSLPPVRGDARAK